MEKAPERNIKKLSAKQQIGMRVILKDLIGEENTPFLSSDFSKKMQKIFPIKNDSEHQRMIGGILGALSKNSIIEKITGDRDPLWMIAEDIYENAEKYEKQIQPVLLYWKDN